MANGWDEFKKEHARQKALEVESNLELYQRNISSPIERIAWTVVADEFLHTNSMEGVRIERQKEIGRYFADIYLEYKSSKDGLVKVVIECDGHDFHEKTKEQASKDKKRDRFMQTAGYKVLRCTGSDIVKDPSQIISDLYSIMVRADGI